MAGGKLRKWRKNSISRRICKNEQNIQKMTNKNGHLSKENLREFACNLNSFRIFGQNVYLKAIFYVVLPKNSGGGVIGVANFVILVYHKTRDFLRIKRDNDYPSKQLNILYHGIKFS